MHKFEQAVQLGSDVKFNLNGDYVVNFIQSNENNDFVRVNHPFNSDQIAIDIAEDHVTILDKGKVSIKDAGFGNFKDAVVNKKGVASTVISFLNDALNIASKIESDKRVINVEVYLRTNGIKRSVNLNGDNLTVDFGQIACNDVIIKSGNLTLKQGGLTSDTLKIKSGNLHADLFFNSDNRRIDVKSANGVLRVIKPSGFNGFIKASGNNVKIDSALHAGDKGAGELSAKLNNGRIKLIEI